MDLNGTFNCCLTLSPVFQLWWKQLDASSTSLDFALSARVPSDRWLGFGPAAPGVVNRLMVRAENRFHISRPLPDVTRQRSGSRPAVSRAEEKRLPQHAELIFFI